MKLALVGVGGAGRRIVDRLHARERQTKRHLSDGNVLVFDTAEPEFEFLALSDDQHFVVGDQHPAVDAAGVEGNIDLATKVTREELPEIRRALDALEIHSLEGILLVAGLGGGTGAGLGSILLDEFQSLFDVPVYSVGVLPSDGAGGGPALNAARSIQSYVATADNLLLFDNEAWRASEADGPIDYERLNVVLATRILSLFGTGERDTAQLPENAIDSSDIRRTLETGGISSIGYASLEINPDMHALRAWLQRLFGRQSDGEPIEPREVQRLVRRAVDSNLTLPCDIRSAERTLVVLTGPASKLSRRGFELSQNWLEQASNTVELLAGDEPDGKSRELTVAVLLSNVSDVERIETLQERAVTHQRQADIDGSSDTRFRFESRAE